MVRCELIDLVDQGIDRELGEHRHRRRLIAQRQRGYHGQRPACAIAGKHQAGDLAPERFWGEWGRRQTEQVSITVHSFEEHGDCVIAHGSMRTFSEGGFSDVQPSWVYFFRDGVLVRGAGYPTREQALAAAAAWKPGA